VIQSFADRRTKTLFETGTVRRWESFARAAVRRLVQLDSAGALEDLKSPPGNRLEALVGDRLGQYSIRVNDQWRICFRWKPDGAYDVEIVDYH
jgi:proteic killer suppression protein